jgi:fructuronate reductase
VDDNGNHFEPSSDPLLDTVMPYVAEYELSEETKDLSKLDELLKNDKIFGVDLFEVGLADLVKRYFAELSCGLGAVASTVKKYVNE